MTKIGKTGWNQRPFQRELRTLLSPRRSFSKIAIIQDPPASFNPICVGSTFPALSLVNLEEIVVVEKARRYRLEGRKNGEEERQQLAAIKLQSKPVVNLTTGWNRAAVYRS